MRLDVLLDVEEKVRMAPEWPLTAQAQQKSYAVKRRRELEFAVSDHIFLKASSMGGVKRLRIRGKLSF